jgi:hypothetical protein
VLPSAAERTRLRRRVRSTVPSSDTLTDPVWWPRHRTLLLLLWGHVAGFAAVWTRDLGDATTRNGLALVAVAALLGTTSTVRRRRLRSLAVTAGLLGCSALLVHLTGGSDVTHFHFFVVLALVGSTRTGWRSSPPSGSCSST